MPNDYKNFKAKRTIRAQGERGISHWWSFFGGLSVGLWVALLVYLYPYDPDQHTNRITPEITVENTVPQTEQTKHAPLPSFDFYEILPQREVNVSEWEAGGGGGNLGQDIELGIDEAGIYVLQIGSFKQYDAADTVKARLALMGITADIQRVVINGKDIRHRVRVGPYSDSEKLSELRRHLADAEMNYVLLKLKNKPTTLRQP